MNLHPLKANPRLHVAVTECGSVIFKEKVEFHSVFSPLTAFPPVFLQGKDCKSTQ